MQRIIIVIDILAIRKLSEKDGLEVVSIFQQKENLGPLPLLSQARATIKHEDTTSQATETSAAVRQPQNNRQQPQTIPTVERSPTQQSNQVVPTLAPTSSTYSPDQTVSHQGRLQLQFHQLELPSSLQQLLSNLPQFQNPNNDTILSPVTESTPKNTPKSTSPTISALPNTPTISSTKKRPLSAKSAPNVYDLTLSPVRIEFEDNGLREILMRVTFLSLLFSESNKS